MAAAVELSIFVKIKVVYRKSSAIAKTFQSCHFKPVEVCETSPI